jgi:hypothetical protein
MEMWLELTIFLVLGGTVFLGCWKSRRFHKEFQKYSDDQKEAFLRQLSKEGYLMERARFWEAGAVTKLPSVFAAIGYVLAAIALLVILFYLVVIVYGTMQ